MTDFKEPARRNAVAAILLFLNLLKRQPEHIAELGLADTQDTSSEANPATNV